MAKSKKNRVVDLKVVGLTNKGFGFAWLERPQADPIRVEIPFTYPGDSIRAILLKKGDGRIYAQLQELLHPSPNRIPPKCSHYQMCGGCRSQHVSYEDQLLHKESLVRKSYEDMLINGVEFHPIIACTQPWHYRNKMDYTFSQTKQGKKSLGLIVEGTRDAFNIAECYLASPWFIDAVKVVQKWWEQSELQAYHMYYDVEALRTLTVREGQQSGDRMVVLTISSSADFAQDSPSMDSLVACLKEAIQPPNPATLSIYLRVQQMEKGMGTNTYERKLYGPGYIRESLCFGISPEETTLEFQIGPSTFFQPNPRQTEKIYSAALKIAQPKPNDIVYNLYCGIGTLGMAISKYVKQVIGIEISPESALIAAENAKRNGCKNVTVISGAVRHVLQQIPEKKLPPADIVIINPPRAELDPEAMEHLIALSPPKILYISCNPEEQAKHVRKLLQQGYKLEAIQPADQFPQTYHVDNIVVLVKEEK